MRINVKGCLIPAIALGLIGFVLALALIIAGSRNSQWRATLTAETPAKISTVTYRSGRRKSETVISYSYTVGGAAYTGTATEGGDQRNEYASGKARKVCYSPADPKQAMLRELDYRCGE